MGSRRLDGTAGSAGRRAGMPVRARRRRIGSCRRGRPDRAGNDPATRDLELGAGERFREDPGRGPHGQGSPNPQRPLQSALYVGRFHVGGAPEDAAPVSAAPDGSGFGRRTQAAPGSACGLPIGGAGARSAPERRPPASRSPASRPDGIFTPSAAPHGRGAGHDSSRSWSEGIASGSMKVPRQSCLAESPVPRGFCTAGTHRPEDANVIANFSTRFIRRMLDFWFSPSIQGVMESAQFLGKPDKRIDFIDRLARRGVLSTGFSTNSVDGRAVPRPTLALVSSGTTSPVAFHRQLASGASRLW